MPPDGTVDVWSASLAPPAPLAARLAEYLSPDERARAARFVTARDRDRFVAGRAFLRLLLARHAGIGPRDLRFRYGSHGKPSLDEGVGSGLRFNLAHSGALAVCALAGGDGELGVDVEGVRPLGDLQGMARAVFSPREFARFTSLHEGAQLHAFYEAWTRKEAFLKALGCGVGRALDSFDVSFGPGEPPRLLTSLVDPAEPERFSLLAFEPAAGCVGAVAVAGRASTLRQLTWRWA